MKKLKIVYVYDAHCSWCYAFSQVMQAFKANHGAEFDYEIISGGMVRGERIGMLKDAAPKNILEIYQHITEMTGTEFGENYLAKVRTGEVYVNSEIPAVALSVFKHQQPERAVDFAHDLQTRMFTKDAKAVNDETLYHGLATDYGLDGYDFLAQMDEEYFTEAARYDFAMSQQLQVNGFPQLFVQTSETNLYLVARGYTDLASLEERIQKIMAEPRK